MFSHPEFTPAPTDEVPGPDLFMTVIKVSDWAASLAWYVETLGLLPVLTDARARVRASGRGQRAAGDSRRLGFQGGRTRPAAPGLFFWFLTSMLREPG